LCFGFKGRFDFKVNFLTSTSERQRLNVKVNINIKVKGFRSPGATYFLFPEKKVGKESGLPGRQGQSRTVLLVVGGFVVGVVVLQGFCRYRFWWPRSLGWCSIRGGAA